MKYVHELDDDIVENIKMMLKSQDIDDLSLAVEILNHTDLSNDKTKNIL